MLLIFCTSDRMAILSKLGGIISHYPSTEIGFAKNLEELDEKLPQAKAVFCLGSTSLTLLQGAGYVPKNKKTTGLRKHLLYVKGTPLVVSYSPSIGDVDHGQFIDLVTDTVLALRLAVTGSMAPQYGDYHYVPDFKQIVAGVCLAIAEKGRADLAFDTETLGLDRFNPNGYIVGLQFSWEPESGYMVAFSSKEESKAFLNNPDNKKDLHWLLNCPDISLRAANGKYDLEWVYEQCAINCTNFWFDTTLIGSLFDENRSNALDVHVKIYAPALAGYSDSFDLKANKARMDLEYAKDPEGFLKYSCGDSAGTLQISNAMKPLLVKNDSLARFYVNILHPAARAFELVERGGVYVDKPAFDQLEADLIADTHRLIGLGKRAIGGLLAAKHYDADRQGGINLTKASLINDFMFTKAGLNLKPRMFTEKTKAPSSSMDHLEMFSEVTEAKAFIDIMREFSATTKTLSTFVVGFMKHLRSDGRLHPSYVLHRGNREENDGGTGTGRLTAKDPAFQVIPKHTVWGGRIRSCYTAPPGYVVLESDYAAGEVRVAACMAHESAMLDAFSKGMDLHALTGGRAAGLTYDEMMALKKTDKERYSALRQKAKAMVFGLLYGMGAEGFMLYAKDGYGVVMTLEEAKATRDLFFRTYPQLLDYHRVYKNYAKKNGCVVSPLGRIKHLPLINSPRQEVRAQEERRAINAPVQSTLSDMMIWAISEQVRTGSHAIAPCFGAIHDASYNYAPEDNWEYHAHRVVEGMETLPFEKVGWSPQLRFVADCKVGKSMGTLEEIKITRTW